LQTLHHLVDGANRLANLDGICSLRRLLFTTSVVATGREFLAAPLDALIDAMLEISLAILVLRLKR
jgi:hypothetical protein